MRIASNNITELKENEVFTFGSNNRGEHLGGAARIAFWKFGAQMGNGHGLQGKSYAIDTMSGLEIIDKEVKQFTIFALENKQLNFLVTEIGCGIAGYNVRQIAPLFKKTLTMSNVFLPEIFINELRP